MNETLSAPINTDYEQIKRLKSANTVIPIHINAQMQEGSFKGNAEAIYSTTLAYCTCHDFVRRKKPCKYIYRLGIELNLIAPAESNYNENAYAKEDIKYKIFPYSRNVWDRYCI